MILAVASGSGLDPEGNRADFRQPWFRAWLRLLALIDHGAAINAVNGAGKTPLELAAVNEQRLTAELLLKKGASRREQEETGVTHFLSAMSGPVLQLESWAPRVAKTEPADPH